MPAESTSPRKRRKEEDEDGEGGGGEEREHGGDRVASRKRAKGQMGTKAKGGACTHALLLSSLLLAAASAQDVDPSSYEATWPLGLG